MPASLQRKTKELLRSEDIAPRKSLGQSFLTDANMAALIAKEGLREARNGILEIGPGTGALTAHLLQAKLPVVAVEKDGRLCQSLREQFEPSKNLSIIHADFLTLDLKDIIRKPRWRLVSNLPYSITTPILVKLLENKELFDRLVVTMQKEYADRLVAQCGSKSYGSISVFVQMWCQIELLRKIPPECFYPRPKVDSALVELRLREQPAAAVKNPAIFEQLVRGLFQHRRKQLIRSLALLHPEASRASLGDVLEAGGIRPSARAEELSLSQLAWLADNLPAQQEIGQAMIEDG